MKFFTERERRRPNGNKTLRKHFRSKGGLKHKGNSLKKTSMSMAQQQAKLSTVSANLPAENAWWWENREKEKCTWFFGTLFLKWFDSTVCCKATKQNNYGHHNAMDLITYALPVQLRSDSQYIRVCALTLGVNVKPCANLLHLTKFHIHGLHYFS